MIPAAKSFGMYLSSIPLIYAALSYLIHPPSQNFEGHSLSVIKVGQGKVGEQ